MPFVSTDLIGSLLLESNLHLYSKIKPSLYFLMSPDTPQRFDHFILMIPRSSNTNYIDNDELCAGK